MNSFDDSEKIVVVKAWNRNDAKSKFETRMKKWKNKASAYEIEEVKDV